MARTPNPYKKFAGARWRRTSFNVGGTRSRLWLAEDHLLAVESALTTEEYRRFYFRDIEAIVIRRTAAGHIWTWVFGVLLVGSAGTFLGVWSAERAPGYLITAIALALFWGFIILIHVLRGPTCQTHIRTAVQNEWLVPLGRVSAARKALARLQPLILAAQGQATVEELAEAPWMAPRG